MLETLSAQPDASVKDAEKPVVSKDSPVASTKPPTAAELVKRASEQIKPLLESTATSATELPAYKDLQAHTDQLKSSLEQVKDPTARQLLEKTIQHNETRLKEVEKGLNDKFMSLAEQRKQMETLRQQLEAQTNQPWTTDRVRGLMQDPNFVQAAKTYVEGQPKVAPPSTWEGTATQWSALSEQERHAFSVMQTSQLQQEQKINALLSQQQRLLDVQEHERVKTRFPDYDSSTVESTMREIIAEKVSGESLKEMLWKAINFDRYVENSYQFGLKDRQGTLQEKLNGNTTGSGVQVTSAIADKPTLQDGERSKSYFQRLAEWNLRNRR